MEATSTIDSGTKRSRPSRVVPIVRVDKRSRLGRRISELTAIYLAALGGAEALSPVKLMKVTDAAQLKAIAEQARGNWLRHCEGNLDDIIRCERKASAAERALGIVESAPKAKTLADVLRAGR